MDKQLNAIFLKLAESYYKDVKSILYSPCSYKENTNIKAARQLVEFIENNIDDKYDRLGAIECFIAEISGSHLVDSLLPFRFLTNEALKQVYDRIEVCDELSSCIVTIEYINSNSSLQK